MPAAAVKSSESAAASARGVISTIAAHADIAVLAIAFPVFVLAEIPLVAYALAAVTWLTQAVVVGWMNRRASAADTPKSIIGFTIGGFIVRAWIAAAGLVVAAVAFDDRTGLAAALLLITLFTAYFGQKLLTHSTGGTA